MTVDSEAIFALAAHSHNDAARARGSRRLVRDRLARRARRRNPLRRPRRRASALDRGWQARVLLRLDPRRARGRRALRPCASCASVSSRSARSSPCGPRRSSARALPARPRLPRRRRAAGRPGAAGGHLLPPAARRAARRLALLQRAARRSRPDALLVEALADEELERRPRAAARVEHPVDLPLGQERVVAPARLGPVGELRQPPEPSRERRALLDRALEPLLPHRDVEARLAQRVRRASRTCASRATSTAAGPCARRCRARSAGGRAPRRARAAARAARRGSRSGAARARRALGRVPRAEVLDHRLRVDASSRDRPANSRIVGERPRRCRARLQLGEDLLVRSSACGFPPGTRASFAGSIVGDRPEAALLGHAKNGRAG